MVFKFEDFNIISAAFFKKRICEIALMGDSAGWGGWENDLSCGDAAAVAW